MQKSVLAIHQSSDGYIWLGTSDGLVRFDGFRFKTFNKENTEQLQDNRIRALLEDRYGDLWIGTAQGGLSCLKDGKFMIYSLEDYPELKGISAIYEDQAGALWIGTKNNGLSCLKNGEFTCYTKWHGLSSNKVNALQGDEEGRLWIATSKGLCTRGPLGKFAISAGKILPFGQYIASMCRTKSGDIWLGCLDGIDCLKANASIQSYLYDGITDVKINCMFEDRHQNLWAGTDGSGLVRVKDGKIETFFSWDGLASDDIYTIYEDREMNLWIGTADDGLLRLRDTMITTYTTREGLSHETVLCIIQNKDSSILIGTENGVNRLKNGKITQEWTAREGLLSDKITAILPDSSGSLWIGTNRGLHRYKNGKLKPLIYYKGWRYNYIFQLEEDKMGRVWIFTPKYLGRFYKEKFSIVFDEEEVFKNTLGRFCIDREDSIWIASYGSGVYRLKDGKLTSYTTNEGLVHNEVECFYEDKKVGVLYIGTRGGLSLLDKGKFTNITTQNGLIDSYVYQIIEDDLGYLWLAGKTGFSRINKKELSDFSLGKIHRINPEIFNELDGLKNSSCNHCIKTRDGRLWFATDEGVAVIDPSHIKKNMQPPPVVIEELMVDGETFPINELLVIPPRKKRMEFYYTALSFVGSRQIKFKLKLEGYDIDWIDAGNKRSTTYTGLSPGKYTFRVTACNSDGVWNPEGTSLSFYLRPDFYQTSWFYLLVVLFILVSVFSIYRFQVYRFRVRLLKNREKELGKLVELRTRDLKERNIELEKAQQSIQHSKELIEEKNIKLESQTAQLKDQSEKLKEMDKVKSRFFANISHEFRTPLTLIMGPLEQMLSDGRDDKERRKLNLMLRNSQRLLGLVNQLLELSKLESGKVKLQASRQNVIPILRGITASFEALAVQRELELIFHAEDEDITLYVDAEKLENIISNLLINAVKFTPSGGKITLTAHHNNEFSPRETNNQKFLPGGSRGGRFFQKESPPVHISVSDTGPGIPREQLANIFDRFYQSNSTYECREKGSGIGLALVKELVQIHHGKIDVYSQEGKGTEFIISLPGGNQHLQPGEVVDSPDSLVLPEPPSETPALNMIEKDQGVIADIKDVSETPGIDEPDMVMDEEDIDTPAAAKEIILVVEDSADVRDYIKESLAPLYTVVEAGDGQEGIQKAQEIIPDLIISDIMMPEVDGYELCSVLKNDVKTSHIPIILLTAKASEENILQGLETGADDYITKPFNTKILKARIKNLIDIRSQLQKNINREMTLQPVRTSVSKIDREFLHDLHEVINKNLSDEEFNVEQLCKRLYMSRTTLYRKVHALTGETPTDFIRSYRLKRGAELLKQKTGTVLEVAFEVGFGNSSYFAKCFKEKFHQLPSTYQASEGE